MAALTYLEQSIVDTYASLRKARFDGDTKVIDVLEMRLDFVPRDEKQGVN